MKNPELKCKGCKGRDEMIRKLSKRIDELERQNEQPKTGNVRAFRPLRIKL